MRQTLPGTIQLIIIADEEETEEVATRLSGLLESLDKEMIQITANSPDRFDPARKKFHITAIPADKNPEVNRG